MKKLITMPLILCLTGCAGMGSGLLEKTMLCDVSRFHDGVSKGRLADSATIQDYPENGYFVYNINGSNQALQSPILVDGSGEYNDIIYTRTPGAYSIKNKLTGNEIVIDRCRKAF